MPVKSFLIKKSAQKSLDKLPFKIHNRITDSFVELKRNPLLGEKLSGELSNYSKLRIGDYRIVYLFDPKQSLLIIVKIEHRQGVYR